MNITEGSVKHWLNVKLYNNNNSSSSSNSNSTTTTNNNNQGSSTPQVWDLRWFGILAGPLLFGTIILPLITGPTVRDLCRSYVTLRVFWRLGFLLLANAYLILFYVFTYAKNGELSFWAELLEEDCIIALSIFVSYSVFNAWRFKKRRLVWTSCVFVVVFVWLLDRGVIYTGFNAISFGFFGWIVIVLVLLIVYGREGVAKRRADTRVS